jgi:hypothetical protein
MDATEQAIDQTLRLTFTGAEYVLRLSGAGTKHLASALWSVATTQQKSKGKARLESLLKSGKELKVFNISESELATFAKEAKRYGVLYAVIKGGKDNPDALVDVMVKTEDAAKINRIVEKLELGRFDETSVVVEAERELAAKGKDATDKGVAQKDTNALLDQFIGAQAAKEDNATENPTAAKTASPAPSEHSSEKPGNPPKTTADRESPQPKEAAGKPNAREGTGFDTGGRDRRSVKAQIEEKRTQRTALSQNPAKPQQTRHQAPPSQKRSRVSKHKTEKGR